MDIKNKLKGASQAVQKRLTVSGQQNDVPTNLLAEIAGLATGPPSIESSCTITESAAMSRRAPKAVDPNREQNMLDNIGSIYYNDDPSFDINLYELQKLPAVLDANQLNKDRKYKKEQLSVVNKRVSALIMQNHPSYSAELSKVTELKTSLTEALVVCRGTRRQLSVASGQQSGAGVRLLAKHRRALYLQQLYAALNTVKTLHETDYRLREMLEEGNYPGAIRLCNECRIAAETYNLFSCIGELSARLTQTVCCIEQQLDSTLPLLLAHFDVDRYARVLQAYDMLGKTQDVAVRLLLAAEQCIVLNCSRLLLNTNAVNPSPVGHAIDLDALNKQYNEHSKLVTTAELCARVQSVLALLWRVLCNYHSVLRYHIHQEEVHTGVTVNRRVGLDEEQPAPEHASFIRVAIERSLPQVWRMATDKLDVLLETADFSELPFDSFMQIVLLITRWTQMGAASFVSGSSQSLDDTLSRHAVAYLQRYHRQRMDELKTFLEHEVWQACPVAADFSVRKLQEFNWLAEYEQSGQRPPAAADDGGRSSESASSYSLIDPNQENPFELLFTQDQSHTVKANGHVSRGTDESDDDELHRDAVDEDAGYIAHHLPRPAAAVKQQRPYVSVQQMQPIMCNTSVNVLRLFGRYMHIMETVPSIAFQVATCLAQLFDLYYFAVCAYFGSDFVSHGVPVYTPRLGAALRRIESTSLVDDVRSGGGGQTDSGVDLAGILVGAQLCSDVSRDSPADLYALAERVVAVESLLFVASQLESLSDVLDRLMPPGKRAFIQQFYTQTVYSTDDVRTCVYGCVATKAVDYTHLLHSMHRVNWTISELMSQHNWYIDHAVKSLQQFGDRLYSVHADRQPVPLEAYNALWSTVIHCVCRVLVEGYGGGSACTTEGRALMLLDLQQLLNKLEAVCQLQPLPHAKLVDDYIKAYYLPEASLSHWVSQHKDVYTFNQLSNLLTVCPHISKKTKESILKQLQLHRNTASSS